MSNFALPGGKAGGWWSRLTLRQSDSLLGYILVIPLLVCIVMLVVYPFIFAVWISFTDKTVGSTGEFIGLGNYLYLIKQPSFTASIVNTVVLVTATADFQTGVWLRDRGAAQPTHSRTAGLARAGVASLGNARICRVYHLEAAV